MISGNSIAFKAVTARNPFEMDQSMRSGRRLEISALEKEILAKMHSAVKIRPAITWLKPFTLERATKKTQIPGKALSEEIASLQGEKCIALRNPLMV
jgi:hypothetical protein